MEITLLYSATDDDDTNTDFRDVVLNPTDDDGVEIPPPSNEKVKVAIMRLKNFYAIGPDEEGMLNDWNLNVLCPVLKKTDVTICAHHRSIAFSQSHIKFLHSHYVND